MYPFLKLHLLWSLVLENHLVYLHTPQSDLVQFFHQMINQFLIGKSLLNLIIKKNDKFFIGIIKNYFNLILPYIYYSLNDKNNNKSERVKEIEEIFYRQINFIIDSYKLYLMDIKNSK